METNLKTLNFDTAMTSTWQGDISGRVPTASNPALQSHARSALTRFAVALEYGVLLPGTGSELSISETEGSVEWRVAVTHLAGREWVILCNLLAFSVFPGTWPGPLCIKGALGQFEMLIEPRLYQAPRIEAPFAIDLEAATGYLQDFVLRIEFAAPVPADMRDKFCQVLDAWVGIVDRQGGFPMAESPTLASVVGPHVCRFEDPATAMIEGEGMATAPDAFALIVGLCIDWNHRFKIDRISLEVVG